MSSIAPLADGTYYISCQISSTYITLDNAQEGANVTAWALDGGPHQQWILTNNTGQYFIRNALYGTYISPGSGYQMVGGNTPYPWVIETYKNGFIVGTNVLINQTGYVYVFNLDGSVDLFDNATPVLLWPFYFKIGPDNNLWFFNSTTTTKATASPSPSVCGAAVHSPSVGVIAGGAVAAVTVLLLCLTLGFFLGKRRRTLGTLATPNHPTNAIPQQELEVPYTSTPLFLDARPPLTASPPIIVSPAVSPHSVNVGSPLMASSVLSPQSVNVGAQSALIVPQPIHHQSFSRTMSPSPEYTPYDPRIMSAEYSQTASSRPLASRNKQNNADAE